MPNLYFPLSVEFIKVGLFTYGGGYGSLPFLYQICEKYNWFSQFELTQLIALSGLTPGPIGLNMATFAGFKTAGLIGAIISTTALAIPMLLITTQVFRLYQTFCSNKYIQKILYILRPTACALICSVGVKLFQDLIFSNSIIDFKGIVLLLILFILTFKFPRNPIIYMAIGGIFGVGLYFIK